MQIVTTDLDTPGIDPILTIDDTDNFSLNGTAIRFNEAPDFEIQNSYSLVVTANDGLNTLTKLSLLLLKMLTIMHQYLPLLAHLPSMKTQLQ